MTTTLHAEFIQKIQQLAALLRPYERSSTISILLKALRNAAQARSEGAPYDEAAGFAWARAEWRVREGLVDSSRAQEAIRLLHAVIVLGLPVFQEIDWNAGETAELTATIRAEADVEVWLS